ncbi:hypothetical protein UJ101_01388 [Flavobacteriaceae bacterium UJ101]|nr:hypothetical protein UJ101_01388 [Flavobacteriaceae bacterium UJ101]
MKNTYTYTLIFIIFSNYILAQNNDSIIYNNLDEIIYSASKKNEAIFNSPINIQKITNKELQNSPSTDFYNSIVNLSGTQLNTNSLTFSSINVRGFSDFSNYRLTQLNDGVDNSSPALNFPLGNLTGVNNLDVESIELISGTASPLYGANAVNGLIYVNTKDPFQYQGLSTYFTAGITDQNVAGTKPYTDFGIRFAKAFNDKLAFKINFSALHGYEWQADNRNDVDTNPMNESVRGVNSPSYDGLNLYGDEIATTLNLDDLSGAPQGTFGTIRVARTGYAENDLYDRKAKSIKADAGLYYRLTDNLTASYSYRFGTGNAMYHASNRFVFDDFILQQHKLELKGKKLMLRSYLSTENAGDTYDTRFAGINLNRKFKSNNQWFSDYAGAYIQTGSHEQARAFADIGRLQVGTDEFNNALNLIKNDSDFTTGAKFIDKTSLWHTEGTYDFTELINFAEIQIGGSFREYFLDSQGKIFTDENSSINYSEYGGYIQMGKNLANKRIRLIGSLRADKATNFDAEISPRLSSLFYIGEKRNHNFRLTYQTGYRNPNTQQQYSALDVGFLSIIGTTEDNLTRFTDTKTSLVTGNTKTFTGNEIWNNSYTVESVTNFSQTGNPADLIVHNQSYIKPEKVQNFEIGYRAKLANRFNLELDAYYNIYKDFIGTIDVITPFNGSVIDGSAINSIVTSDFTPYQLYANSTKDVNSYGFGINMNYNLHRNLNANVNYNYNDYESVTDGNLIPNFNMPKHQIKLLLNSPNIIKNVDISTALRWNNSYQWKTFFAPESTIDAKTVFDAQITYNSSKLFNLDSFIKVGGTNIFGKDYEVAYGSGRIGSQYYISLFLK